MAYSLTIIIATYNAEKNIRTALDSVINQKYQDWECIVIDGLSQDSTINIVKDYAVKDKRIRYVSEKDKGIYDAFNKGLHMARGEWIYYLGSDDELTSDGLAKHMRFASVSDKMVGVVNGGVIRITQDGGQRKMLSCGFVGSHQGMIMRKRAMEELNGFNLKYKIIADYDLMVRMRNSHWGVVNTNTVLAYFNAGGASEKISSSLIVFKEKYDILKNNNYSRWPFMKTVNDFFWTFGGNLYHSFIRIMS